MTATSTGVTGTIADQPAATNHTRVNANRADANESALRRRIDELTDKLWSLAAVQRAAERGLLNRLLHEPFRDPPAAIDKLLLDVLVGLGVACRGHSGEYEPSAELLAAAGEQWLPVLADELRTHVLQVTELIESTSDDATGWAPVDPRILQAQGQASSAAVPAIATFGMQMLDGLAEKFAAPAPAFLDVGTGVAGIAVAAAQHWPQLRVVGIDVYPPALELAATNVAAAGVGERVQLRHQDIADLDDENAFDLAWLPAMFVPARSLTAGIARVFTALRPGGWLAFGILNTTGDDLSAAIARWRLHQWGGGPITTAQAIDRLTTAGFIDVWTLEKAPPGTPPLIFGRRPPADHPIAVRTADE